MGDGLQVGAAFDLQLFQGRQLGQFNRELLQSGISVQTERFQLFKLPDLRRQGRCQFVVGQIQVFEGYQSGQ